MITNIKHKNSYKHILKALGLSDVSSDVYLFLLRNGESLPTDIAKSLNMYRPAVYKALTELEEKHLILLSSIGKRTVYSAESPEKLEQLFRSIEQDFLDSIEDMYKEYESGNTKPTVAIQEGEQAVRDAYSDVVHSLDKNETYYRYSSIAHFDKNKYVPREYKVLRDKKNLERLVITGIKDTPHYKKLGRSVKVVPKEYNLFQDGINVLIYKDKVAIIDYVSDTTITIKHKVFAEFQKKIFKLLYSKL